MGLTGTPAAVRVVRGAATGWYPYPSLAAAELGFARVWINIAVLILTLGAFSLIAFGIVWAMGRSLRPY